MLPPLLQPHTFLSSVFLCYIFYLLWTIIPRPRRSYLNWRPWTEIFFIAAAAAAASSGCMHHSGRQATAVAGHAIWRAGGRERASKGARVSGMEIYTNYYMHTSVCVYVCLYILDITRYNSERWWWWWQLASSWTTAARSTNHFMHASRPCTTTTTTKIVAHLDRSPALSWQQSLFFILGSFNHLSVFL